MRYLALISGGKDSIYAIHCLQGEGHELVCLLHMRCGDEYQDSYMYQTVGSEIASLFGECLGVPMFVYETECRSVNRDLEYFEKEGDEVEDLYAAISMARKKIEFEGVSSGAILSVYQKNRVEDVCSRLSLLSLSPLWGTDQNELMGKMISSGIEGRVVKVASSFLNKKCINMSLGEIFEHMKGMFGSEVNFCGEGGEYESVVLDCPLFKKRISIEELEICGHPEEVGKDGEVFYMKALRYGLHEK